MSPLARLCTHPGCTRIIGPEETWRGVTSSGLTATLTSDTCCLRHSLEHIAGEPCPPWYQGVFRKAKR